MKYLQSFLRSTTNIRPGTRVVSRLIHSSLLHEEINNGFENSLPKIIENVSREKKYIHKLGMEDKLRRASEYNIKTVNNIGSVSLLHAYSTLECTDNVSPKVLEQALVLAWAVEMVHSHNLMIQRTFGPEQNSDIGSPVNDANLLQSFLYVMLEKYFHRSTCYNDLLQLFNQAFMYNALSRYLEQSNSANPNKYLDFDEQRYNLLCEYNSGYQSFTLPLTLAIKLANKGDEKFGTRVDKLCSKMGKLYQMKKDYNDCFAGESIIGIGGSDIQRGRCTWLATEALRRVSARQRIVWAACYGGAAPAHVERVKLLYKQLALPQLFREKETAMCEEIKKAAEDLEKDGFPSVVFVDILKEIMRYEHVNEELI